MKKKLILFSFLSLFCLSTLTANAQSQQQNNTEQTCCSSDKKQKHEGKKGDKKCKGHKKGPRMNPFEGIELTAEQQQKIDKLKSDRKEKREQEKRDKADKRKKEREAFNKELESILTPDQMAQYNANCEKIAAKKKEHKKNKDNKGPKDNKGDKKDKK